MRQRPVRSGGSGRLDRMMWVVQSDEGGDGRMKMGTNPDNRNARSHKPMISVMYPRHVEIFGPMYQVR